MFCVFLLTSVLALFMILSQVRVTKKLLSGSFSTAVHLQNPCFFIPAVMNLSSSTVKEVQLHFDLISFCCNGNLSFGSFSLC